MLLKILREFPASLYKAWVIAICISLLGGALNLLVIHSNGGKMPTATSVSGHYVIYPMWLKAKLGFIPDHRLLALKTETHSPMTTETRFRVLANRFYVISPVNVYHPSLPKWLVIAFIRGNVPILGQEMHASLGDFVVWIGLFLFAGLGLATTAFSLLHRSEAPRLPSSPA